MKTIKLYTLLLFALSFITCIAQQHKPMGPVNKNFIINDYDIDTVAGVVYAGGDFPSYNGDTQYRNNLIAIDAKTGALLAFNPFTNYYKKVNAVVCHNGKIYLAAAPEKAPSYVEVYNPDGTVAASFTSSFNSITKVTAMAAVGSRIYLLGDFTDNANTLFHTAVLDETSGKLIRVDQAFEGFEAKKIVGTDNKLLLLSNEYLRVYNRATYTMLNEIPLNNYGIPATDFLMDADTAYVTGAFSLNGKDYQGCLKFDVSQITPMNWTFGYANTCTVKDTLYNASCGKYYPYDNEVSTIAANGNDIYVGGQINYRASNGDCYAARSPFLVNTKVSNSISPLAGLPLFENKDWRVRKYKIWNERLYYIRKDEACSGFSQQNLDLADKIAAYCLPPAPPGEFINPISSPCIGQDYVLEVKERAPNLKYVWSCDVPGVKITPNGNKATLNFPYFKFEYNIEVAIINDCGLKSSPVYDPLFESTRLPGAIVSGEDKTLTCTRTSFSMKATSNENPVSYTWIYPDGSQSGLQEITVSKAGNYTLKVLNSSTGCIGSQNVTVGLDTVKPVIKNPLTYTITSCNPFEVTATGLSDSTSDKINWYDNGTVYSNPAVLNHTGNFIEEVVRIKNGCATKATVKVTSSTPQPTIIPPSTAVTDANGNVTMDTLTCIKNTVLMNFTSNASNYKIDIKRPSPLNDTVPNNSTVDAPGFYTINVQDLTTFCKGNPMLVEVKADRSKPQLVLPATVPTINCSFSTAVLDGKSATPGTTLKWTGSGNFSSPNPATVTQPGYYVLTVIDSHNGCTKEDSVNILKQNTLEMKKTADTIICLGSTAKLTAAPIGGTPSFTYVWSPSVGNTFSVIVKPVTTTSYTVIVKDAGNCVGSDTVVVKVPAAIRDSTITYAPCDPASINGQIQVFASGGIPPYSYSKDNGLTYQSSQIFANLAFGNYQLSVRDSLGCTHAFSKSITAQSQKPTSDFIINTTMMAKDTFVVVDISNPRPDTIIWKFPASVKVINTNFYAPIIVSVDTGEVEVTMETHFGTCVNNLTKKIKFIKKYTTTSPTKGNGIEELNIFPNPNRGEFTVEVKMFKKQRLAIYVFDAKGVEQIRVVEPVVDYSSNNIVLPLKTPGTYVLKVIAEFDSKVKAIVVTQ
ncbi:MAG TPA: T9SS type A sorting domain-containing protein [Bacteroidia bacterium]|jgi:hypothetical protein|nr:T9SS type A sorting domain-containing protein [Bacteroidia bacterium]